MGTLNFEDHGALEEAARDRIDVDVEPLVGEHGVVVALLFLEVEGVLEAAAAAASDRDSDLSISVRGLQTSAPETAGSSAPISVTVMDVVVR